ncbi:isoprenylcysteine carboxylmethyltransferase family protein [Methylosinus sp. H3A]|uniref:methyltransferase family protein n=1 Tax=Methylosinus sp. H3A TaxID=2785786 RepID=UPI0018C21602|nr:isoprenylcysteine carboxylmethyltransferase family protein [Methylosinus sp. H3A]MBG0811080.1 isoprenylcysteine carboxylmethyltransferase family protein [Methylosinus sp. H3A]
MPVNASEAEADPPSRIAWPPRLVVVVVALGALLDAVLPLYDGHWPTSARVAGGLIVALALANDIWCALLMRRQGTTMRPDRAVSSLVIAGPFRWSRNPIYVSHVALVAGLGLAFGSVWMILLTPALAFGLQRLAIEREERHLSQKFGAQFDAYVARTRRWL